MAPNEVEPWLKNLKIWPQYLDEHGNDTFLEDIVLSSHGI
jgi:hypothetical protein